MNWLIWLTVTWSIEWGCAGNSYAILDDNFDPSKDPRCRPIVEVCVGDMSEYCVHSDKEAREASFASVNGSLNKIKKIDDLLDRFEKRCGPLDRPDIIESGPCGPVLRDLADILSDEEGDE